MKISVLAILLTAILAVVKGGSAQAESSTPIYAVASKPGCANHCGTVAVPYPFGLYTACALSDDFVVDCNVTTSPADRAQRPFLSNLGLEVLDLNILTGKIRLLWGYISYVCGDRKVVDFPGVHLNTTQYTVSYTDNVFVSTGCGNTARIDDSRGRLFGCASKCGDAVDPAAPTCSGTNGCCQVSIPTWLTEFTEDNVDDEYSDEEGEGGERSLCSSVILAETGNFTATQVNNSDVTAGDGRLFPIVWDWVVEKVTCDKAVNRINYACVYDHTECVNSTNGSGYLCKCSDGFQGNPYLPDGCKDVNECEEEDLCPVGQTCVNTEGSYICTTTTSNSGLQVYWKILIGAGVGLPVLLLVCSWVYWVLRKRKYMKRKDEFFRQNGGALLQQHISNNQSTDRNTFKIFTAAELAKATKEYCKENILGKGGFGTVYRGVLEDGRVVAIKKSMAVDESKSKEFARELLILSQINHVNVVKLLGCCLEVEAPMLVYEYVPNGTLYHHIHQVRNIDWQMRLNIAADSARALGYLHAEASPAILHGDVKSSNILLARDCTAKVSDFGTSTLAPKDRSRFMTVVQGTWGYLDPEYLQSCQLTEKSDVYSFGVVMAELLTGRKALFKGEDDKEKSLACEFSRLVKQNRALEILDDQILDGDAATMKQVMVVAKIVAQCVHMSANERPTMSEVSTELETMRRSSDNTWKNNQKMEEMTYDPYIVVQQNITDYSNQNTSEYSNTTSSINQGTTNIMRSGR